MLWLVPLHLQRGVYFLFRMLSFVSCYGPAHSLTPSPISTQDRLTLRMLSRRNASNPFFTAQNSLLPSQSFLVQFRFANRILQQPMPNAVHSPQTYQGQPLVEMCLISHSSPCVRVEEGHESN